MLPKEIEKKFIISYLPDEIVKITKIKQKHIYKDSVCSIRVRKSINLNNNETIYTHTIKTRREDDEKFSITELEREIKKREYDKLKPFEGSKIIEKDRCIIPLENGLNAEVDIYYGDLKGLIIAEVEFKNVQQAEKFKMPNWFKKEVFHKDFSNRKISTLPREEILKMIGARQLDINKRIFKFYQKNKKIIIKTLYKKSVFLIKFII